MFHERMTLSLNFSDGCWDAGKRAVPKKSQSLDETIVQLARDINLVGLQVVFDGLPAFALSSVLFNVFMNILEKEVYSLIINLSVFNSKSNYSDLFVIQNRAKWRNRKKIQGKFNWLE